MTPFEELPLEDLLQHAEEDYPMLVHKVREEVARLKAELADAKRDYAALVCVNDDIKQGSIEYARIADGLKAELASAREALRKYGEHSRYCLGRTLDWTAKCDCGYEKALASREKD